MGEKVKQTKKRPSRFLKLETKLLEEGIEPSSPYGHNILSVARMPFRHSSMS